MAWHYENARARPAGSWLIHGLPRWDPSVTQSIQKLAVHGSSAHVEWYRTIMPRMFVDPSGSAMDCRWSMSYAQIHERSCQ